MTENHPLGNAKTLMDTITLRPRQFRMIDTGSQQSLGASYSSKRPAQMSPHLLAVFMNAVGQISFSMSPRQFHWIQFRRIAWESIDMEASLSRQKLLDDFAPMDFATIPNDKHISSQVTQQLAQENNDFQARDVVGMESRIKPKPTTSGRDGQDANDRYFVTPIAVSQNRRLTHGSPCPTNVGNQQKPALVEKSQMGPKSLGLFLYVAKPASSIAEFSPRPVATPVFQASDSSIPILHATASTRPQGCTEPHIDPRPVSRSVSGSTTPWCAPPPRLLSAISLADLPSVPLSGGSDVPSGHVFSIPSSLSSGESGSTAPCYSARFLTFGPPRDSSALCGASSWPGNDAIPTVRGFHGVSCHA